MNFGTHKQLQLINVLLVRVFFCTMKTINIELIDNNNTVILEPMFLITRFDIFQVIMIIYVGRPSSRDINNVQAG